MTMDRSSTAIIAKKPSSQVQSMNGDIKQQYKQVYVLLKQFDDEKRNIKCIEDIFDERIESIRNAIVEQSTALIYQTEYEVIGRKCREVLWFKGFYDLISLAKRFWKKNHANDKRIEDQVSNLIIEGISHFKLIIINIERHFGLDLRNIMDFSFLDTYEKNFYTTVVGQNTVHNNENRSRDEITKYALETIHALLISLGDLHRYFIDFDFNMPKISKDFAANYYHEAFKLNPKSGMAHNQLGTLLTGSNYDLDSIYHYLYSLSCPLPFELSDSRAMLLFEKNSNYLGESEGNTDKADTIGLRDFIAHFLFVADAFFYDKDIVEFNSLCHCLLMDFRKLLQSNRTDLNSETLFKMVAIFFFCMIKLRTIGSSKFHSLNAFLVALCAECVDACMHKFDKFASERTVQDAAFQAKYTKEFDEFELGVRLAREKHKQYVVSNDGGDVGGSSNGCSQQFEKSVPTQSSVESMKKKPSMINGGEDVTAGSSGRDRESDVGKSTQTSSQPRSQPKRKAVVRRRRRRMVSENSNSELSYCSSDSEFDMDTDFSSDDASEDDDDDNDSWCSSENEEEDENKTIAATNDVTLTREVQPEDSNNDYDDDDDDVIIETEEIIYPNAEQETPNNAMCGGEHQIFDGLMSNLNKLNLYTDGTSNNDGNHMPSTLNNGLFDNGKCNSSENGGSSIYNSDGKASTTTAPEKLRYKQKYNKIDPNIVIEFFKNDAIVVALKLLFSWLRANNNILINCFTTNPEFIDKIFDLLNRINIDIFTRKVYMERHHIQTDDVREELRTLFDMRQAIPLKEDVLMKEFPIFDLCQRYMEWSLPISQKITENEETILRIFDFVDFGFSLCKMKKFNVSFCSRSRKFIQTKEKRSAAKNRKRGRRNRKRTRDHRTYKRRNRPDDVCLLSRDDEFSGNNNNIEKLSHEESKPSVKKGYLKKRQQMNDKTSVSSTETKQPSSKKHELMGKLWLQHEIEVLEEKMSKNKMIVPPYIIVDTKALTENLDIVKRIVKAKKTVVLIPKAVLAALDDLKKTSDVVRNLIRWLELEFTKGNRFIRLQRNNESKQLSMIKIPKKLDRDTTTFVLIAQFCNFIGNDSIDLDITLNSTIRPHMATFLTGDKLNDSKYGSISCTGILDAIGMHYETIREFYAKFKKK